MKKVLFWATMLLLFVFVSETSAYVPMRTSSVKSMPRVSPNNGHSHSHSHSHRHIVVITAIQIAQSHRMQSIPLKTGVIDSVFVKDGKYYAKIDSLFEVSTLRDVRTDSLIVKGDSVSIFSKAGKKYIISEVASDNATQHHPMPIWVFALIVVFIVAIFGLVILYFSYN